MTVYVCGALWFLQLYFESSVYKTHQSGIGVLRTSHRRYRQDPDSLDSHKCNFHQYSLVLCHRPQHSDRETGIPGLAHRYNQLKEYNIA